MNGNKKNEKLKLEALNRIDYDTFKKAEKLNAVVALDDIRSMNNVGSFFRTGDAFRIEKLLLVGITPTPPHRDIHKTALGATQSVIWEHHPDIEQVLKEYKELGYIIVGIEQVVGSVSLEKYTFEMDANYLFVFGNETEGLTEKALPFYDFFLEIPQAGTKHSFNVSTSAGIVLWEIFKEWKKK